MSLFSEANYKSYDIQQPAFQTTFKTDLFYNLFSLI
jgi:hypothetical protein